MRENRPKKISSVRLPEKSWSGELYLVIFKKNKKLRTITPYDLKQVSDQAKSAMKKHQKRKQND